MSGPVLSLFLIVLHTLLLVLYFGVLMRMTCSSSTKTSERELVSKAIITLVLRRRLILPVVSLS